MVAVRDVQYSPLASKAAVDMPGKEDSNWVIGDSEDEDEADVAREYVAKSLISLTNAVTQSEVLSNSSALLLSLTFPILRLMIHVQLSEIRRQYLSSRSTRIYAQLRAP